MIYFLHLLVGVGVTGATGTTGVTGTTTGTTGTTGTTTGVTTGSTFLSGKQSSSTNFHPTSFCLAALWRIVFLGPLTLKIIYLFYGPGPPE